MKLNYQHRIALTAGLMLTTFLAVAAALWLPKIDHAVEVSDAMIVLDITDSMNVEDATWQGENLSRMAAAKHIARDMLQDMPCGSKAGLAVFSEARSLILINPVEVCNNYNDLTNMLEMINPSLAWVRSSEVSKAVFTAIRQMRAVDPKPSIVFITDGHESPPVHPELYPKFPGTPGEIAGVLVGVGGDELVPIPKTNEDGEIEGVWDVNDVMHQDVYATQRGDLAEENARKPRTEHLSKQKRSHLADLANRVGFGFVSSPSNSKAIFNALKDKAETRLETVKFDPYQWFAGLALLLFLLVYLPYSLFGGRSD